MHPINLMRSRWFGYFQLQAVPLTLTMLYYPCNDLLTGGLGPFDYKLWEVQEWLAERYGVRGASLRK